MTGLLLIGNLHAHRYLFLNPNVVTKDAESRMDITRSAATPAKRDLFVTDNNAKQLAKKDAEAFHSVAAKLAPVRIYQNTHGHPHTSYLSVHLSIKGHGSRPSKAETRIGVLEGHSSISIHWARTIWERFELGSTRHTQSTRT